jgi:hypothetical protein
MTVATSRAKRTARQKAKPAGEGSPTKMHRSRRDKGVEPIRRDAMLRVTLSFKARGIIGTLVSLPDDWETHGIEGIAALSEQDGYTSTDTGVRELEDAGLVARLRRRTGEGKFEWLWLYSDDPADVFADVRQWSQLGYKPLVRKPDRKKAAKAAEPEAPDGAAPAPDGSTIPGKPGSGDGAAGDPPSIPGFSVYGSPADGSPVDGSPGDLERHSQKTPPSPPSRGEQVPSAEAPVPPAEQPDTCTHGKTSCRTCGTSPRSQEAAAKEAARAALQAAEHLGRSCAMCQRDPVNPLRWRRVREGVPINSSGGWIWCDHETPLELVLAEVDAADAQLLASGPPPPVVTPPDRQKTFVRASQRVSAGQGA